jgi:peptide/nickel transport system permease protein
VAEVGITLVLLLAAAFLVLRLAPGGPAQVLLGPDRYTPELEARLNARLGLDRPLLEQFGRWVAAAVRGELGDSYFQHRPAAAVVLERLPATLWLCGPAFVLAVGVGVGAGVWAAASPRRWIDRSVSALAVVLVATPHFWLGIGLIVIVSAWLGLLPSAGLAPVGRAGSLADRARHLLLPVLTLGAGHAASLALYTRAAVRRALTADSSRTARAKGGSEARVVWGHALPTAAIPIATVAGLQLAHFFEASLLVESVFAWPGIGQLTVTSVGRRDYPVLLVVTLAVGLGVSVASLLTDLVYQWLDPRWRSP